MQSGRESCAIRRLLRSLADDVVGVRPAPAGFGARRLGIPAVLAAVTLAAFVNALAVASRLAQTSDSAYGFVVGHAIAGGNVLLTGWRFPLDDYYFTDAAPYAFFEWLFGPRPFLLVLVPSLTYSLFVLAALLACFARERTLAEKLTGGAVVALLLAAPCWTGQWNPLLLSDMHVATVLAAFVVLALCTAVADMRHDAGFAAAALAVIACATVASDPFALVFAFGPALVILAIDALSRSGARLAFVLLAGGAAAGLLLPHAIAHVGGFSIENDVLSGLAAAPQLGRNLLDIATGVLTLFGANFFAAKFEPNDILLLLVRGIALILAVAAILRVMRHAFVRDSATLFDRMLCAGILTVLVASALSVQFGKGITPQNLWAGGPPMRYLVPVYLFAAVLAGRQAPELLSVLPGRWVRTALAAGAVTIAFGGFWLSRLDRHPVLIANNPPSIAAAWLERHALVEGVGEYWSANLVTAMSGDAIRVRSVVLDSGRLVPYVWVEDARWYAQPPQFVIWQDNNKTGVTWNEVRTTWSVCRGAFIAGYRIAVLAGQHSCRAW